MKTAKPILLAAAIALAGFGAAPGARDAGRVKAAQSSRPNVLFIAVDDLRPELGCYGEELVRSPHIDRLAARGLRFTRAFCQQAICGPSRASLMTGLRPDSDGVTDNATYFRKTVPDVITLPQQFWNHGYETVYIGKIYHGNFRDEEHSWSRKATFPKRRYPPPVHGYQLKENQEIIRRRTEEVRRKYGAPMWGLIQGPAWEAADVPDDAYEDGRSTEAALATLRELRAAGKPFFLAVGFHKPHLPFIAPKRYWDLYDPSRIKLAGNPFAPKNATSLGLHSSFELRTRYGIPKSGPIPEETARRLIHAYLACVSYIDAQIGRILAELDRLGLRDNTIILVWGDHGWHLGEHGIWGKATNFEVATRVPLLVTAPGQKARGVACGALVELADLYPTLCDLAGLPLPKHLEGTSFAPLLDEPNRPWKKAVFSQFPSPALREWAALPLSDAMRQTFFGPLIRRVEARLKTEAPGRYDPDLYNQYLMGYTMRTDRYRFTRWVDTREPNAPPIAVELYDHETDPEENTNIAADPVHAALVEQLTRQMKAGWKAALPEPVARKSRR